MPIFGKPQKACDHCGQSIDANAKFCPYCGQPTGVVGIPCPHCGQTVAANARFCPACGRQLDGARAPDLRGSVWRKSPDEFAVRVEPADLRGTLYKELEVQPGQQVVLLVDGRADEERQGPGRYTVDSLFERVLTLGTGRHVTGLLVDGGSVPLEFQFPKIYTQDAYEVSVRCVVGVEVVHPVAFFTNVLKSARTLTVADLRSFLFDEVRDAVQDVIGQQDIRQLATGLAQRDRLANAVDIYLNNTLSTSGLRFGGVRTVEISHPQLEALRAQWETIRLARDKAEADLTQDRERKLADVRRREELWQAGMAETEQKTREQREQVRTYEERAAVWEQARRAIMSEEMNQVRTKEDFADFLATINERQVLRQEELDVLSEEFASRKEDRASARAHTAYLAELERDYNRKQAELVWKTDFTLDDMASSLKIEQQRLTDAGLLDGKRWDNDMAELMRGAKRTDWERAETTKRELFDRGQEKDAQGHRQALEKAETLHRLELRAIATEADLTEAQKRKRTEVELQRYEAERRGIQRQIEAADFDEQIRQKRTIGELERNEDKEDLEIGLNALARMKAIKREEQEATLRTAREDELTRKAAAHQQEMDRIAQARLAEEQRQRFEIERLATLGKLGSDALIAASGPEQGAMLVSLARTKAMEGKSAEEILAMAAENSPAVAAAFQEKFRAIAEGKMGEREQALFERLLKAGEDERARDAEERRQSEDRLIEAKDKSEERISRLADKLADGQATALSNLGRSPTGQSPQVIVVPSATGQPQVIQTSGGGAQVTGSGTGEVQVCPRCRVKSPVGEKYCSNCGFSFYEG